MRDIVRDLDRLLRGRSAERGSDPASIPIAHLVQAALVLGVTYGLFMGLYAALRVDQPTAWQIAVSAVKVPLLFLLTLVVTFPSLYVFSALGDSPLRGTDTLRLLLAAVTVNLALLASFGPITGFFTLSTESYPFIVVLNTVFFALSGFVGLGFLRRSIAGLFTLAEESEILEAETEALEAAQGEDEATGVRESSAPDAPDAPETADASQRGARTLRRLAVDVARTRVTARAIASRRVFRIWIVIYAVVGAQMAWILRPFIGTPHRAFALFRPRGSNFFEGLWHSIEALFG